MLGRVIRWIISVVNHEKKKRQVERKTIFFGPSVNEFYVKIMFVLSARLSLLLCDFDALRILQYRTSAINGVKITYSIKQQLFKRGQSIIARSNVEKMDGCCFSLVPQRPPPEIKRVENVIDGWGITFDTLVCGRKGNWFPVNKWCATNVST